MSRSSKNTDESFSHMTWSCQAFNSSLMDPSWSARMNAIITSPFIMFSETWRIIFQPTCSKAFNCPSGTFYFPARSAYAHHRTLSPSRTLAVRSRLNANAHICQCRSPGRVYLLSRTNMKATTESPQEQHLTLIQELITSLRKVVKICRRRDPYSRKFTENLTITWKGTSRLPAPKAREPFPLIERVKISDITLGT